MMIHMLSTTIGRVAARKKLLYCVVSNVGSPRIILDYEKKANTFVNYLDKLTCLGWRPTCPVTAQSGSPITTLQASCIIENLSSWSDAKFSIKAFISAVARCGRWKLPNYTTVEINKISEFNSMFTVLRLILYQILNWFGASSSCDRKEFLKLLIVWGKLVCSETVVRSCGDNFWSFSAHTCEARKTVSVNERNFNASTN